MTRRSQDVVPNRKLTVLSTLTYESNMIDVSRQGDLPKTAQKRSQATILVTNIVARALRVILAEIGNGSGVKCSAAWRAFLCGRGFRNELRTAIKNVKMPRDQCLNHVENVVFGYSNHFRQELIDDYCVR